MPCMHYGEPVNLLLPFEEERVLFSSVQFSSVQFSSVQFNGVLASLAVPTTSGASDREGTALRNWHGWTSGAGMVWLFPVPRVERARAARL